MIHLQSVAVGVILYTNSAISDQYLLLDLGATKNALGVMEKLIACHYTVDVGVWDISIAFIFVITLCFRLLDQYDPVLEHKYYASPQCRLQVFIVEVLEGVVKKMKPSFLVGKVIFFNLEHELIIESWGPCTTIPVTVFDTFFLACRKNFSLPSSRQSFILKYRP